MPGIARRFALAWANAPGGVCDTSRRRFRAALAPAGTGAMARCPHHPRTCAFAFTTAGPGGTSPAVGDSGPRPSFGVFGLRRCVAVRRKLHQYQPDPWLAVHVRSDRPPPRGGPRLITPDFPGGWHGGWSAPPGTCDHPGFLRTFQCPTRVRRVLLRLLGRFLW